MQQVTGTTARMAGGSGDRRRVETVVETLATVQGRGESLLEVAHEARNMVTALGLYCDLIEEPGVLSAPYAHYANELRLVASASRRLVEKLVALDAHAARKNALPGPYDPEAQKLPAVAKDAGIGEGLPHSLPYISPEPRADRNLRRNLDQGGRWDLLPAMPVANLAAEVLASRDLLSALAGPAVALTLDTDGGAQPLHLAAEDLTRVLVNLVKNAAEAMPRGGRIHVGVKERPSAKGTAACAVITIEDSGPGIPEGAMERIFTSGYTTKNDGEPGGNSWPVHHRGLGLAITRSIIEAAGGRITAANREWGGARFEIELPVRTTSAGSEASAMRATAGS